MHSPLFVVLPESAATLAAASELSTLQIAQLTAAANYHALRNPGALLELRVTSGSINQMPALTDITTIDGSAGIDAHEHFAVSVRSLAVGSIQATPPERPVKRSIRVSHPAATPATTEPPAPASLPRRVYRELEQRSPVALDAVRETLMQRRERAISAPLERWPGCEAARSAEPVITAWSHTPAAPEPTAPRAVLFGLHWLQTGGAERWALESVSLAKAAGFLPVIVTDQNSVHPWLTAPELADCVIITMSFPEHLHTLDIGLTHALLENYNFSGVMIHHCQWLYLSLPWIAKHRPDLPVVDSLHIVEYLGGGYPGLSVQYDRFIDRHHAISPELVRWMTDVQGVDATKIDMAPLAQLTTDVSTEFAARDPQRPFSIAFIGRLSRQKRPDVFLLLVHRLHKLGIPFHAIMHGDGEMRDTVDGLIDHFGLQSVLERRYEDTPVSDTLDAADLLVITSINEGLTLTTFEAVATGVPVLSADVGSQRTIVQDMMLVPRPARPFIRQATSAITALAANEKLRERHWAAQRERIDQFNTLTGASQWMKELLTQWQA
ncbi:glycosyltransferase family 4 protein [Leucobacter insecticola]|uniref:Glycosyltransferase family 4 protein n=1 Tax=Leucobacter insecticola TaxID=2714934 RepID=A0A6G8FHM4_9MICO|nr:glycosyltransferase [Leucobacter insecticola]QIM15858.1 glycosyltransferase family 4 protein [Leucobacter insecticola]